MSTPLFNTQHAPVGAWASLTFGVPGVAVSVDVQEPKLKKTGAMIVGMADSKGIQSIGFADQPKKEKVNLSAEGDKEKKPAAANDPMAIFHIAEEEEITRTLTPSCDTFAAGKITFRTYTPYSELPDPEKGPIPMEDCLPGIVMDITADNRDGSEESVLFFGFCHSEMKRIYALQNGDLCSLRFRNEWAFSAEGKDLYLVRGIDAAEQLMKGTSLVQQNGPAFICTKVPAGAVKTLTVVWSLYEQEGSNGTIPTHYYYNRYFKSLDEVTLALLDRAEEIRLRSREVDCELLHEGQDEKRVELFSQAVRAYYGSTQLLEAEDGSVHWNVGEGAYVWRNTMDLCADHIAWELKRNPWIVRNLMDEFIRSYTYYDRVTFPDKSGDFPGGLSFTHDMGCYFTYSNPGYSAYERSNETPAGFYFYMTTEELLNGIYCIAGYALKTGDKDWLMSHYSLLADMMTSLENRDAHTAEERNGILKASSTRGGTCGLESTTYDALDHSLLEAAGNVYVFIKTWCALWMLRRCCAMVGDKATDERAVKMIEKCRASAALFRSADQPWLKANAYKDIPGAVAAAVEPLAVVYMLKVFDETDEPGLFTLLREHSAACLQKGVCVDDVSGGLRLSSTSRNTWPSKSVLTIYAMEKALGMDVSQSLVSETIGWAQKSAKNVTISDQILSDTREVVGALCYPRIVTAALWL